MSESVFAQSIYDKGKRYTDWDDIARVLFTFHAIEGQRDSVHMPHH